MLRRTFGVFAVLAAVNAAALIASLHIRAFVAVAVILSWPAFLSLLGRLILGADETTERYGAYGEIALVWLISLPWVLLVSWAIAYIWRSREIASKNV